MIDIKNILYIGLGVLSYIIKPKQKTEHIQKVTHKQYCKYLSSSKWKAIKKRLLMDNYTCTTIGCNKTTNLTIHHLTYKNFGNENLNDLITLCKDCHKQIHLK